MVFWFFILFISVCSAMEEKKLLVTRLIDVDEDRRVTHYCSESRTQFKHRKKKEYLKKDLVQKLQERAQAFGKRLIKDDSFQRKCKNPYEFHVQRLLQEYTKTFQECKNNRNLLILLFEFDFNLLRKDKYRDMCRWLVPCVMAFNDETFDEGAKMDFISRLSEKCAHVMKREREFVFKPRGMPYDDIQNFLKLISLYNVMLLAGDDTFVANLKERHLHIDFDTVNYIDVIANFDCIAHKQFEMLEQKDPTYHSPELHLKVDESLKLIQEKARCYPEWKQAFDKVWLVCLYWKYRQIMRTFNSDSGKQVLLQEFWNDYFQKRVLSVLLKLLHCVSKPFVIGFNRFDKFLDAMLLKLSFVDDYYDSNNDDYGYGDRKKRAY